MLPTALLVALMAAAAGQAGPAAPEPAPAEIDGLKAKFVDVNGVPTRYYDYGQGQVLLLIHGGMIAGASTANNWSRNVPGLAKHFRVIAVDRLAQGMTGNPKNDADFTNEAVARHIYEFIQTLKLGPVHLVGHSAGGGIAFYVAIEHPEVARTLTVISAGPQMPSPPDNRSKFDALLAKCPPDTASYEHLKCRLLALGHTPQTFPADYEKADDYMGNLPKSREARKRIAATRAARPGWPERDNGAYRQKAWDKARAGGLKIPVLIFTGKQDTLSWGADEPHAMMRRELGFFDVVASKNPRVKMIVINEAGHFPYREHPEEFNADLTHFIEYWNRPGS